MKLPKLIVKKSNIHGTGVFAAESIKEDQKIIEYKGEKVPSKEGDRRSELDEKLTYIFILNDNYDIDGSVNGNDARFINHSCKPNTYIDIINERIWIIAERDIAEGEELTYDYELVAEDLMVCECGSESCRGYINDPDDKNIDKFKEEAKKSSKNI